MAYLKKRQFVIEKPVPDPTVSIVTIAFNEASRIANCVQSVLSQRGISNLELIVVDDGSRDATSASASAAAPEDLRLRVVRLPENSGRGAARTAGVGLARGSLVGFIDADVTLPPDWLIKCLAALPGYGGVGGTPVPDGDAAVIARLSGATPKVVPARNIVTGSNVLFRREVLEQYPFDAGDRVGEDTRLVARLTRAGIPLKRVPGLVVSHYDDRSFSQALAWRFETGGDAATLWREQGRIRFSDLVWGGWLLIWLGAAVASVTSPSWLLLGIGATIGVGGLHAASRFQPRPLWRFLVACLLDVPMMTAYLFGRTLGMRSLFKRSG